MLKKLIVTASAALCVSLPAMAKIEINGNVAEAQQQERLAAKKAACRRGDKNKGVKPACDVVGKTDSVNLTAATAVRPASPTDVWAHTPGVTLQRSPVTVQGQGASVCINNNCAYGN